MVNTARSVVLIVEDEFLIRMGAISLVEDLGYEYFEASNADEAIVMLDEEITIVFTDIQMAGSIDGLQLAEYARKRWPPLNFIIVSGNCVVSEGDIPSGAHFFRKPYNDNAVGQAISSFCFA
jgi:CheY-like chemotaxis protein